MAQPSRERRLIDNVWRSVTVEENGGNGGSQPYTGPYTIYGLKWQTIDMSGDPPAAGTFKLSYGVEQTAAIDFDATAAEVQSALEALPSLTGKVTCADVSGGFPSGAVELVLDDSLAPFELLTVSNNSLGVADPLIYVASSGSIQVDLSDLATDTALDDFLISRPEQFGSGSRIYFSSTDGAIDWRPPAGTGSYGLALDIEDNDTDEWTAPGQNDGPESCASVAQAFVAAQYLDTGTPITIPVIRNGDTTTLQANVNIQGQGTGGVVKVWVKTGGVPVAP